MAPTALVINVPFLYVLYSTEPTYTRKRGPHSIVAGDNPNFDGVSIAIDFEMNLGCIGSCEALSYWGKIKATRLVYVRVLGRSGVGTIARTIEKDKSGS